MRQHRPGSRRLFLACVLLLAACAPATPTPAATFATLALPTPGTTPRDGGCTSPTFTSRQLLDKYFSLAGSTEIPAVMDCFAVGYAGGEREGAARFWTGAGPISRVEITRVDQVNGCDRYRTVFDFARPDPYFPNPWTIFYSVGPEGGTMRIFDGATALPTTALTAVICR